MPLTNFPNGVSSFGVPSIGAGPFLFTGNVFFVSSTKAGSLDDVNGGYGRDPVKPFATVDYAIGQCTANQGDAIIVMPGHVETIVAAAGVALDVAGVSILGLGNKRNRPTFNFTTAVGASFKVTAANCRVSNVRFTGGIDALTNPIHVLAADFELDNFTWLDVTGQATDVILTTAAADRMHLHDFEFDSAVAAGPNAGIAIVGGDGIRIHDFIADGNFAVGFIDVRTTATTDLKVYNCWSYVARNAADIFAVDTITASTGQMGPNLYLMLKDNAANITEAITGATFIYHLPISIANLAGEVGMQTNITASTDA